MIVAYNQPHDWVEAMVKIGVVSSAEKKLMESVVQHNVCRGHEFICTTRAFPQGNATPEAQWVIMETRS